MKISGILRRGVFGTSIATLNDFHLKATSVIQNTKDIRASKSLGKLNPKLTLIALDAISNEICSVMDVAEAVRHCHIDEAFVSAAEKTFHSMHSYVSEINADLGLYSGLCEIVEEAKVFDEMTMEEQIFATDLKKEFETAGVQLEDGHSKEIANLRHQNASIIESNFLDAVTNSDQHFLVGPIDQEASNENLRYILSHFVEQDSPQSQEYMRCSTDDQLVTLLLSSANDEALRRQVWMSSVTCSRDKMKALAALMRSRQELAAALGYASHSEKVLKDRMIQSPDKCMQFLTNLQQNIRLSVQNEIKLLSTFSNKSLEDCLSPWNTRYLINRYQRQDSSPSDAEISSYLSLSGVLRGVAAVTSELFGVKVRAAPISPDEAWGFASSSTTQKQHQQLGMFKFDLLDADDCQLGTIFIDSFKRKGKLDQPAHLTIQCACVDHRAVLRQAVIRGNTGQISNDANRQLPVVALIFNFNPSPTVDPLLSLGDLECIYHEWGHALHSLFSRTTFQHLSGTRGGVDYVEIPSHLFEHYAREPAVVRRWARHHATGQDVPPGLLEQALLKKQRFKAIEEQSQIMYSVADQVVFGSQTRSNDFPDNEEYFWAVSREIAAWQSKWTDMPSVQSNTGRPMCGLNILNHTHFVSYGGEYYSYLFAKQKAKEIWDLYFHADPLNRQSGARLREQMLSQGAAKPPTSILKDMIPSFFS